MNIGLGCGITLGGLKAFPFKQFQCVELEKKILTTAPYFAKQNLNVLEDPRLQVIINDGRNHLLLTDQKYDVITSDPFEPLVGGAANLYTLEHFENGRKHLSEGGVFAQYLPLYQLSPDDYRMIIRTFCRVFPHVTLWYTGEDSIMLGTMDEQKITLDELKKRMAIPEVKKSLAEVGITTPEQLLQTFVMDPKKVPEVNGEGKLNTDRRPRIEFSAPRSHLANTTPKNLDWLLSNYRPQDMPLDLSTEEAKAASNRAEKMGRFQMEAALARYQGNPVKALGICNEARKLDPSNRAILFETAVNENVLAKMFIKAGGLEKARDLLDDALSTGRSTLTTLDNLATLAFHAGKPELALEYTKRAIALNPRLASTTLRMALCFMALHKPSEALPWCEKAMKLNPEYTQAYFTRGDIAFSLGEPDKALELYKQALNKKGAVYAASDWRIYGAMLAKKGRLEEAKDAVMKSLDMAPDDSASWLELARLYHALGRDADAAAALSKAKSLRKE